jgi:hypothetical protein
MKRGDNLHTKPARGRKDERKKNLSTGTVAGQGKKEKKREEEKTFEICIT